MAPEIMISPADGEKSFKPIKLKVSDETLAVLAFAAVMTNPAMSNSSERKAVEKELGEFARVAHLAASKEN